MPSAPLPPPARPSAPPPEEVAALRPLRVLARAFSAGDIAEPVAAPRPDGAGPVLPSTASLFEVIQLLTTHERVDVAGPGSVLGQIAREQLQQLPGRTWLFGMVAFIELYLTRQIGRRWSEEEWAARLTPNRLGKAREVQAERDRCGDRCQLLDCLQLADKAQLLIDEPDELAQLGFESKGAAKKAMGNLERLRNRLAHSQPVVDIYWTQIANLVLRIERILMRFAPPAA